MLSPVIFPLLSECCSEVLTSTPIPARRLRGVFEKAGFQRVRSEGDHYVYSKKGVTKNLAFFVYPVALILEDRLADIKRGLPDDAIQETISI